MPAMMSYGGQDEKLKIVTSFGNRLVLTSILLDYIGRVYKQRPSIGRPLAWHKALENIVDAY